AIRGIASISRGAPGVINTVCARALLIGQKRQVEVIDQEIIEECFGKVWSPVDAPASASRQQQPPRQNRWATDEENTSPGVAEWNVRSRADQRRREMGRAARHRHVAPYLSLLVAFVLVVGGYWLSAGWFARSRQETTPQASPNPENDGRATVRGTRIEP